jgi:predicted dehydrogenase
MLAGVGKTGRQRAVVFYAGAEHKRTFLSLKEGKNIFIEKPLAITADAASIDGRTGKCIRDDNVSITIRMSGGSPGTIIYTARGSKAYSRERMEALGEERVVLLDDFRTLELVPGAGKIRKRGGVQAMGDRGEVDAFFSLPSMPKIPLFRQGALAAPSSIAAVESLTCGRRIRIEGVRLAR